MGNDRGQGRNARNVGAKPSGSIDSLAEGGD
jgi:hypothetical protein